MMGVYTGTAVNTLSRITNCYTTCTDGSCAVTFPVTVGTTYQFAVDGGGPYGDSGEYRLSLDVKFDTNAPLVAITNLVSGQTFSAPAITVSGTAADPAGVGSINYSSGVKLVEVRLNNGAWLAATGTNVWSRTLTLAPGANLIEARSRDQVGNESSLTGATVFFGTRISQAQMSGGSFEVSFPTELNKTYQLECVSSLVTPSTGSP